MKGDKTKHNLTLVALEMDQNPHGGGGDMSSFEGTSQTVVFVFSEWRTRVAVLTDLPWLEQKRQVTVSPTALLLLHKRVL